MYFYWKWMCHRRFGEGLRAAPPTITLPLSAFRPFHNKQWLGGGNVNLAMFAISKQMKHGLWCDRQLRQHRCSCSAPLPVLGSSFTTCSTWSVPLFGPISAGAGRHNAAPRPRAQRCYPSHSVHQSHCLLLAGVWMTDPPQAWEPHLMPNNTFSEV